MSNEGPPSVYNFLNYREFLLSFYRNKKEKNKSFSYNVFSKMCGLKSYNYLLFIVNNTRNLTPENTLGVAKACKLDTRQTEYFSTLVQWNQSKDSVSSEMYFERLKKLMPKDNFYLLREMQIEIISRWYFLALMELTATKNFRFDSKWIRERLELEISEREIQDTYEALLRLGLLIRKEEKLEKPHLTTFFESEGSSAMIQKYHEANIPVGLLPLRKVDVSKREYAAATMALRKQDISVLKRMVKEFHKSVLQYVQPIGSGDDVYQLNIQLFPITRTIK